MSANKPLVAIGLPCGDHMHSETAQCLWGLGRASWQCRQGIVMAHSSIVANARNNCVSGAKSVGADYLMFIDSDMLFPPTVIDDLLKHGKSIVGGTYVRRGPPFDNLGASIPEHMDRRSGLIQMTHMPTGMLLIHMSVFDMIPEPWFEYETTVSPEGKRMLNGEDMTFSKKCREAGIEMYCDLDLSEQLRHLYVYPLSPIDPSTRAVAENYAKAAREGAEAEFDLSKAKSAVSHLNGR